MFNPLGAADMYTQQPPPLLQAQQSDPHCLQNDIAHAQVWALSHTLEGGLRHPPHRARLPFPGKGSGVQRQRDSRRGFGRPMRAFGGATAGEFLRAARALGELPQAFEQKFFIFQNRAGTSPMTNNNGVVRALNLSRTEDSRANDATFEQLYMEQRGLSWVLVALRV